MPKSPIPEDVAAFVCRFIESVEELEVLLLLFNQPERTWADVEVNAQIQSTVSSAAKRLAALAGIELLTAAGDPPRYRFAPRKPELAAIVGRLADAYKNYRTSIIELIYEKPSDHVLGFAKAFDLRKRP